MGKTVLVTGSAGFIGSHLVEQLAKLGYNVRAFVHYNSSSNYNHLESIDKDIYDSIEIIAGDIIDPYAVRKAVKGCDSIFHLAALIGIPYSYLAPSSYVQTNIIGTLNVLEAGKAEGVQRIVHTSTSEAYGTAQYTPIDEKHPVVGQSPYSATKIAADKLAESYWLSFHLPVVILRPFNTYGPRQSMRAVIPTIIAQALNSDKIKLGSLTPVRDLTFVSDTANGFICAEKSEGVLGQQINLGVGQGISIGELVDKIGRLIGKKIIVETDEERVRPDNSEVMKLISNNSMAKEMMDWEPLIHIDEGLKRTIEYIREHINTYKRDSYIV